MKQVFQRLPIAQRRCLDPKVFMTSGHWTIKSKLGRHENFMIRTNFVWFKHVQPRRQPIQFSRIMCINSHVVQIGFIVSLHSQCTCHRRKQPSNNDPQTTRVCELQTHELRQFVISCSDLNTILHSKHLRSPGCHPHSLYSSLNNGSPQHAGIR